MNFIKPKINNIFITNIIALNYTNCSLFLFFKIALTILFFLENFLQNHNLKTSIFQLIMLKLNSDNNTFLIILVTFFYFFNINFLRFFYLFYFIFIESFFKNKLSNLFDSVVGEDDIKLNLDLTNGLLLIHPLLLYYILSYIIIFFFNNQFFFKNNLIYCLFEKSKIFTFLSLFLILLFSIVMGAW